MAEPMDWRRSYAVMERDWIADLHDYRKRGLSMCFDVDGEAIRAYELDADQIRHVARRMAEQDVQRAINKYNESLECNKARRGYAL